MNDDENITNLRMLDREFETLFNIGHFPSLCFHDKASSNYHISIVRQIYAVTFYIYVDVSYAQSPLRIAFVRSIESQGILFVVSSPSLRKVMF